MSLKYLNWTGLTNLVTDIKNWVTARIPTKTSEITNDSGFITSSSLPTVNNATLTIQKNGTTVKTFTANASSNVTCNITVPTKTSELTNDSGFLSNTLTNNTSRGALGWSSSIGTNIPTLNTIAYWNGAYTNTTSNLAYCVKGAFGDIVTHNASEFLTSHQAVSNSAPTLAWGTTSTIGTVGGTALTVKMPANPNTNTTYSAGTGLSLSGTTFSLALTKALVTDALGYTPPTQDTNTDTKVTQTVTTGNTMYPVIAGNTANATATETNGVRFSSKLLMNTRYGYLRGLSYDSDNLKGVAPSATRTCGGSIQFYTYDGAESGRLWNEGRTGDRLTYLRVSNYITNGALSTTGTQVSNAICLAVTNAGERKTWTDGNWACNLNPDATNSRNLGTSSLYWKSAYVITQYMGGDIVFNGTYNLRSNADNSYVRIQGGSGEGNGSRIILSGKSRSGLQGYAEIVATDGSNTNTFTVKPNGETLVNGNNLAATIIKGLSISGKTITYTQINGSTGTLTTQDTVYTHPTTAGNKHIPSGGSSGQILKYSSSGTAVWADVGYIHTMDQIASRTTVNNGTWSISCTAYQLMIITISSTGSNVVVQHLVNVTLTSGASSLVPEYTTAIFSHSSTTASATLTRHVLLWTTANTVKITISNVTNLSALTLYARQ